MLFRSLNAEMPLADVFFDYDMSVLKPEARTILQRNVDWMKRWTSTRVTVEGHADSRGTSEYNLALGDRRANVVRDYMISLGIAGDRPRLHATSLGHLRKRVAQATLGRHASQLDALGPRHLGGLRHRSVALDRLPQHRVAHVLAVLGAQQRPTQQHHLLRVAQVKHPSQGAVHLGGRQVGPIDAAETSVAAVGVEAGNRSADQGPVDPLDPQVERGAWGGVGP